MTCRVSFWRLDWIAIDQHFVFYGPFSYSQKSNLANLHKTITISRRQVDLELKALSSPVASDVIQLEQDFKSDELVSEYFHLFGSKFPNQSDHRGVMFLSFY